jgi:hypothetical protein
VPQHRAHRPPLREQAAALISLLAVAGAVVLLLAGIVVHLAAVLLTIVSLLVFVTAGWYAVSRRRLIRLIALAAMIAALAALITGLVFAGLQVLRFVLVLVLAVLSLAAARGALRTVTARRGASAGLTPADRPRHPVLIMNLKSGGGKAERFGLARECEKRGIEAVILRPGDDLRQLAEDAVGRGADVIGMAGGDGSQALVASVAIRHDIPHVCIPAGTRNHFALDLGLDRDDVVGALDAFAHGADRRIDLAAVNGRIFVNNVSLGLYAKVVQSAEYRDAKVKTAASMLPDLIGPDAVPFDLRFRGPDGAECPTAQMILVSNDPYQLDARAARPRGTRHCGRPDQQRRRGEAFRRAAGGRADPPVLRLARVGRGQVPGQLGRAGRGRSGRGGPGAGPAAGVRVAAGRAAGAGAAPRQTAPGSRAGGPSALPLHHHRTGPGGRRSPG